MSFFPHAGRDTPALCCWKASERSNSTTPLVEDRPLAGQSSGAALEGLTEILGAHIPRGRSQTEYAIVEWKYQAHWDMAENLRESLRHASAHLRNSGLPASHFVLPGGRALSPELHASYEDLLRLLISAGLDLCAARRIPLEQAYRQVSEMENERHARSAGRADAHELAFHTLALRYLDGLADAQACERALVDSLDKYAHRSGSMAALLPPDASCFHLQNRSDCVHMLASGAHGYFFHNKPQHFYRRHGKDATLYDAAGQLLCSEVEHPGSTAAACVAMALVLDRLPGKTLPSLQWLDQLRSAVGNHTQIGTAFSLSGPAGSGECSGITAAQVKSLLANYAAAVDASVPGDLPTLYRAIALLCKSLYRLQPFGSDHGLVGMAVLQCLLLQQGLPAVRQQQTALLGLGFQELAAELQAQGELQRHRVADLTRSGLARSVGE